MTSKMNFSEERLNSFSTLDDVMKKNLSEEEIFSINKEVEKEVQFLKSLQESISKEVASYMAKEGIGFNELTRRLGTSTRQTSRVIKGEANLTLATIAEISSVIGKSPRILFE